MEKSKNAWLQMNEKRITALMMKMEEERFKSSYQGQIDFTFVMSMMKGMINEIENLQKVIDSPKS